ncbi:unnamed protein product [Pylaiella littoralis]
MWRVDAATKLKDKLIMANELINGYSDMRKKAIIEVQAAMAKESIAVARFRNAQAQANALLEKAAATARAKSATDSPSWSNDNSSSTSSTSNGSSSGGATTCSASSGSGGYVSIERSESPASALTNALAAGSNIGNGNLGSNRGGGSEDLMSPNPASAELQGFSWTQGGPAGWGLSSDNVQQQQQQQQQQPSSGSTLPKGNEASEAKHQQLPASSPFPSTGGEGMITSIERPAPARAAGIGGAGAGSSPSSAAAAAVVAEASRVSTIVQALRREAQEATTSFRAKESVVVELVNRQKRAEAGREELVLETKYASDSASKASQAAMHYEQVACQKRGEEAAALQRVNRAEWDAKAAGNLARQLAEVERRQGPSAFGSSSVGSSSSGLSAAAATGVVPGNVGNVVAADGVGIVGNGSGQVFSWNRGGPNGVNSPTNPRSL